MSSSSVNCAVPTLLTKDGQKKCTQPKKTEDGPKSQGMLDYSNEDISIPATRLCINRDYRNLMTADCDNPMGWNWYDSLLPQVVEQGGGDTLVVLLGPQALWFDKDGASSSSASSSGNTTYTARYGDDLYYSLVHDEANGLFVLTQVLPGSVITTEFKDMSQTEAGMFYRQIDESGHIRQVMSYTASGDVGEIQQTIGEVTFSLLFEHYATGDHASHLQYATLRKTIDVSSSSDWTELQRAEYLYYESSEDYGSLNDLKAVKRQVPSDMSSVDWEDVEISYYRYYKSGESNGFEHGLKYVVGPQAYANLLTEANYDPLNPPSSSSSSGSDPVPDYADHYYEYDDQRRVSFTIGQCGCCDDCRTGASGNTYTRTENALSGYADGYNAWKTKVETDLADGSKQIVFLNYLSQIMLVITQEEQASSSAELRQWFGFVKYGESAHDAGLPILTTDSFAITGYDEDSLDLLDEQSDGSYQYLKDDAGLLTVMSYGDSTTATSTTAGTVKGYSDLVSIKEGQNGEQIKQEETKYIASDNSIGEKVYVTGEASVYPSADTESSSSAEEKITTSYAYEWYDSPARIKQRTTTFPAIPVEQNGNGVSATAKEYYDTDGNLTWQMNQLGIVDRYEYNDEQLVVRQTLDVGTVPNPPGWSVTGGTHEEAISDYEYDDIGRQIQELGPAHQVEIGGTAVCVRGTTWNVFKESVTGDQNWIAEGYATSSASNCDESLDFDTFTLVNPVSISFINKLGANTDVVASARSTGSGKLSSSDTFLRADWSSWTYSHYSIEGLEDYQREYHSIPSQSPDQGLNGIGEDPGLVNTNYEETYKGYDSETNELVRIKTPGGTIKRIVHGEMGRTESEWVGTDDVPTGGTWEDWSPTNTAGTNMTKTTEFEYDNGMSGGDLNLTKVNEFVDDSDSRSSIYSFDFRNRQISELGEESTYSEIDYNNLDQTIEHRQYDNTTPSTPLLIGKQQTFFDNLGRTYRSKRYAVNSSGVAGNALVGNTWYDAVGIVTKSIAEGDGSAFSTYEYDNLGRPTKYCRTVSVGGSDVIVEESESTFDKANNQLFTTTKILDTDTTTSYRSSYIAYWYDGIGRRISEASYGATGTTFDRPSVTPTRSDTVLVSTTDYNDAGTAYRFIDPTGVELREEYDDANRKIKRIDNYQAGVSSNVDSSVNRTTEWTYNADSNIKTLTAKMDSASEDQVTTYIYGVTTTESYINSNLLLHQIVFANSTSSNESSLEFEYNRQLQEVKKIDQSGTVHEYDYDGLGRQIADRVSTLGANLDDTVMRITTDYLIRGMRSKITSYSMASESSSGDAVQNQVEFNYNDFNQVEKVYQAHDGIVNVSTTPKVEYSYADGASSSNQIRMTKVTYPDGREVSYDYGTSGQVNDELNRIESIKDGTAVLASYKYLGLEVFTQVDYEDIDVRLKLWGASNTYPGLDRFNRVIETKWHDYGASSNLVDLAYTYNRNSIRLTQKNSVGTGFDHLFAYDGLERLLDAERGTLNANKDAITSKTFQQAWALDQVGNWNDFDQDDDGSGWDLQQARTNSKVNEITDITEESGDPQWPTPTYDDAGNTITFPKLADPTSNYTAVYDAWNRLVTVREDDPASSQGLRNVASFKYDGQGFRIVDVDHDLDSSSASTDTTYHNYYTTDWQIIERRVGMSSAAFEEYIWGIRTIGDLISRTRIGESSSSSSDEMYALQDVHMNVVAIFDPMSGSGQVVERYGYTSYGNATVYDANYDPLSESHGNYEWAIRYSGYWTDLETELNQVRNRTLHSGLGRWLQTDPSDVVSGINMYQYASGNPVTFLEPYGVQATGENEGKATKPKDPVWDSKKQTEINKSKYNQNELPPTGDRPSCCPYMKNSIVARKIPKDDWTNINGRIYIHKTPLAYKTTGNDPSGCVVVGWVFGAVTWKNPATGKAEHPKSHEWYGFKKQPATTNGGYMVDAPRMNPEWITPFQRKGKEWLSSDWVTVTRGIMLNFVAMNWKLATCIYNRDSAFPKTVTLYKKDGNPVGLINRRAIQCFYWWISAKPHPLTKNAEWDMKPVGRF